MYRSVPKNLDFPALERKLLEFWEENDTFHKLRARNKGGRRWSFLDGPITANNPMGVHHAWGRSYKDMFERYFAMNGYDERYQNGFDCQGLWVEVDVEKSLGFKTKTDIYRYGIDRFVVACKARVLTYAARQTEQSIRLGYWMDWDDPATLVRLRDALESGAKEITITAPSGKTITDSPERIIGRLGTLEMGGSYFTFSDENNYTIWSFLKKCHEQGYIYRGHDVMPWCPRCETGISQMEVTEGRRITKHTAVFVRFPLVDDPHTALLVWTTTPWTLPANVAVAVNPDTTYLKVRHDEWTYIVGKVNFERDRVQDLSVEGTHETHKLHSLRTILKGSGQIEILGEVKGGELIGLRYKGPFDELPAQNRPGGLFAFASTAAGRTSAESHQVIGWGQVSDVEGTGLVHIAPGCGAEDQELGLEYDLVFIAPLDDAGNYVEGFGDLVGRNASEVADTIVEDLRHKGYLVAKEAYPHVYPFCWRCKHELVFRPVEEWFIRMDWRDRIQRVVPQIRWIPPDGEAREQDWLRNMGDWMISKKRFWGLALPIWVCHSCGHFTVIGSKEELRAKAIAGWEAFEGHTPHRPWVDQVKITCERCGAEASRIEDVGNPWLDAGIVSFSTMGYNSDREFWSKWFPADFVVESFPGQFRNWFYSLLAMSAMMVDQPPFKTLLGHAMVRDARGEDMHKSRGNAIAFDDAAEVLGAEVMRYIYARQEPAHNLNFPDLKPTGQGATLDSEVRRKLLTFWNCYSFFVTYAEVDKWRPKAANSVPVEKRSTLDRWMTSRLQRLIETARASFEGVDLPRLIDKFEAFNEEFSNWYLRRSRRRFWKSESDSDKQAAYETLYEVLTTVARVMAPVLPFLREEVHQNLVRTVHAGAPESVHLTAYPEVRASLIDENVEAVIDEVIRIKNLALHLRTRAKVKIRQPLATLYVRPRDERERGVLANPEYAGEILDECNIKELKLIEDERPMAKLVLKPQNRNIALRYGRYVPAIAAHLAAADAVAVLAAVRSERGTYEFSADGAAISLTSDDVRAEYESAPHIAALEDQGTFVALDATLSKQLEREGIARDFNRHVQEYRKAKGLAVSDRIVVRYRAPEHIQHALGEHDQYLRNELLAERIEHVDAVSDGIVVPLAGADLAISIEAM
jgi:isoleucyl-tRNA synthetase